MAGTEWLIRLGVGPEGSKSSRRVTVGRTVGEVALLAATGCW